jgi:hypothetical protein
MNNVKQYRKKPVVIEAFRLDANTTPSQAAALCGGKVVGNGRVGDTYKVLIETLEGDMAADYGDYIIKGVKGEFYPCKPDIFEATYEQV